MISPETSGEILTSISGWIFPVAVTSCVMVFRKALSVVMAIGAGAAFVSLLVSMRRDGPRR